VGRKIGDKLNGYRAETAELPSLGQAARWLCDRALELYPESEFAKDYLRTHRDYQLYKLRFDLTDVAGCWVGSICHS